MIPRATRVAAWSGLVLIAAVFCEVGSRVDDWFFDGIPVLAGSTYDDLFTVDATGRRRGRPNAVWNRVHMNNLGMRGEDVSATPVGCRRWMFLGASETFGEPSVVDAEYPARVRKWHGAGCIEVFNTAFPGLAPYDLPFRYRDTLAQYRPDLVFVYPSTHLYLGELPGRSSRAPDDETEEHKPPPAPRPVTAPSGVRVADVLEKSRFLERLRDTAEVPPAIQRWRTRRWIDLAAQGKPQDWAFQSVPMDRLALIDEDLMRLIAAIRASGAEPVLMTHAVRVTSPPRESDYDDLFAMRVYAPRASEQIIAEFEYEAADRMRQVAARSHVRLVDVAKSMSGRRDRFIDLVHFTSQGHAEVAKLIHEEILNPNQQEHVNVVQ
jgi:hypothetical protein